jgi:hypothetical protein
VFAALAKVFSPVQGIGGEQDPAHAEDLDQRLRGRDLLGRATDFPVGQDQRGLAGAGAEHVGRRLVAQVVEAALERLAVQGDDARSRWGYRLAQPARVPAEGGLQLGRVERLEQGAQRVDGRRPAQRGAEHRVQALAMHGDEHQDAAVGGGTREDGQHREQQEMGQRVAPSLAPARVGDPVQGGEQVSERHDGGLRRRRVAGQPRTPANDPSAQKPPSRAALQQNRTALGPSLRHAPGWVAVMFPG